MAKRRKPYSRSNPFVYGTHPNPSNWTDAAAAVRSVTPSPRKQGPNPLLDRLARIEASLKERK